MQFLRFCRLFKLNFKYKRQINISLGGKYLELGKYLFSKWWYQPCDLGSGAKAALYAGTQWMSCSCRVLPSPAAWRVSRQPCTCRTHGSCCRFRVEAGPTLELVTELATLQPETRQYRGHKEVSSEVTRRSVLRPRYYYLPAQCVAAVASGVIEADEEVWLLQHPRVLHHVSRVSHTCSVLGPHVPSSRVSWWL